VPLLLLPGSALADIPEMVIFVELLGATVPEMGAMSNHVADGSAVNAIGVLPAWRVHVGGFGMPRQVRQVWLTSWYRSAVNDWSVPSVLFHELVLSSCGESDAAPFRGVVLLWPLPQLDRAAAQQNKLTKPTRRQK